MDINHLKKELFELIDQIEDLDTLLDYYVEFDKIIERTGKYRQPKEEGDLVK